MSFIYWPFAKILEFFYNISGENYVIALFFFAIVFKLLLLPSSISQQKGASKQQRLQPKIRRIQARFAGDQRKIQEETQALYQREGYSPLSAQGCLPLLIQMPIIWILYRVIYSPISYILGASQEQINTFVKVLGIDSKNSRPELLIMDKILDPANLSKVPAEFSALADKIADFAESFSILDVSLTTNPNFKELYDFSTWSGDINWGAKLLLLIPVFSGVTALLTSLITHIRQKKENPDMAKNPSMGCMTFGMPLMSVVFTFTFPAGIGVYWIFQNILSAVQMVALNSIYSKEKVLAKTLVVETIQRRSKEENIKRVSGSGNEK